MKINRLARPEGNLAYDVAGSGPLIVCVPGMGELRQSFRHLVPLLTSAGFRVGSFDLRGHGDSDTTFTGYDDVALASDILAFIAHLDGPATVVGNSMGAGAAVIAAAQSPQKVNALALLGPFVRDPRTGPLTRGLMRVALSGPWAAAVFLSQYPKWFPGARPADFAEHRDRVAESLKRPAYRTAFSKTARTSHAPAQRALRDIGCPSVVVMGLDDIDWPDPAAEARWISEQLDSDLSLLEGVGHYPQAQAPTQTAAAILNLLERVHG